MRSIALEDNEVRDKFCNFNKMEGFTIVEKVHK